MNLIRNQTITTQVKAIDSSFTKIILLRQNRAGCSCIDPEGMVMQLVLRTILPRIILFIHKLDEKEFHMKYVLVFCAVLMLFSCTLIEPRSWDEVRCKGKVKNGRYYDKGGLFSIDLPKSSFGMLITEQTSDREYANILFQDMLWTLQVIVKKFDCPFKVAPNSSLKDIFNLAIGRSYLEISSDTKRLYEENIEGMYFSIFEVPGASRTINLGTGKRCTAIKASLIFIEDDLLVTLITDLNDYFVHTIKDDPEMCYKMLKDELMKDRKSFKRSGSE